MIDQLDDEYYLINFLHSTLLTGRLAIEINQSLELDTYCAHWAMSGSMFELAILTQLRL